MQRTVSSSSHILYELKNRKIGENLHHRQTDAYTACACCALINLLTNGRAGPVRIQRWVAHHRATHRRDSKAIASRKNLRP